MFTKADLKQLLAEGKMKQTIKALLEIARSLDDNDLINDVTLQSGRFEQAEQEKTQGTIDPDDLRRQLAQINHALLSIIDDLPQDAPILTPLSSPTTGTGSGISSTTGTGTGNGGTPVFTGTGDGGGNNSTGTGNGRKPTNPTAWIVGLALLVGMVLLLVFVPCPTEAQFFAFRLALALAAGGLATLLPGMFGFEWNPGVKAAGALGFAAMIWLVNPGSAIGKDKCNTEPFNITVFVHGKGGKQDMILRQQGNVFMDLAGQRRSEPIRENGQVFFQNFSPSFNGQKVSLEVDFSEPYKSINPDSLYTLSANGQIYLPVALQGLDRIFGTVIHNEQPLTNVVVSISSTIADTTDANGSYELLIPEAQQRKEQEVKFVKDGYKMQLKKAFPQTQEPLNVVLVK